MGGYLGLILIVRRLLDGKSQGDFIPSLCTRSGPPISLCTNPARLPVFMCASCALGPCLEILRNTKYFDGDLWIEAFEADTTMTESGKTTVVNIYR